MSALMILQLRTPLQLQLAEAKVTAVLNPNCKEVRRDEGLRPMGAGGGTRSFQKYECIHEQTDMEEKIGPKSLHASHFPGQK